MGEAIITLKCENDAEMQVLIDRATEAGLNVMAICDAGRTEVAAGSRTVIAIGPHTLPEIDSITKQLKLYR